MSTTLMLHCGADKISRAELAEVKTPEATDTHFPVPHSDFLDEVTAQLAAARFTVRKEEHALSHEGARYFGVLDLQNTEAEDYSWVVGLRNSHDKSFSAAVAGGTRVFVCDNLAFSGEIKLERKHTKFVSKDLRALTGRLMGKLNTMFTHTAERFDTYKKTNLDERDVDHILMSALRSKAITARDINPVWNHWQRPEHKEFKPRTAWSLFNAFTGCQRQVESGVLISRGEILHGLFDGVCGVPALVMAN